MNIYSSALFKMIMFTYWSIYNAVQKIIAFPPLTQFIILPQISYHCNTYLHNTTCTTEGKHGIQRKITQKGSKTKRLKKKSERLAQQIIILKDPKKSNDSGKENGQDKNTKIGFL